MGNLKDSWGEAGSRLSSLGLKLKYHLSEERSDAAEEARSAVEKLREVVEDTFEALGNAAKDPAVKDDVVEAGRLVRDAIGETFNELGDEVRKAFKKTDS